MKLNDLFLPVIPGTNAAMKQMLLTSSSTHKNNLFAVVTHLMFLLFLCIYSPSGCWWVLPGVDTLTIEKETSTSVGSIVPSVIN